MPKGEQREMRQREVRWEKLMGGRRGEQKREGNKEEMKKGETTAVSITKQNKNDRLVVALLDVQSMWFNSPQTFHPHFLRAETDGVLSMAK